MPSSIFAIELCIRLEPQLHDALRKLVTRQAERVDFETRWQIYRNATQALSSAGDQWRSGCWDFFDDNEKAKTDFQMWVQGMMTREGARKQPSGTDPYRGEARFLTFTMSCMLEHGSTCERDLASVCDISEGRLWKRSTFEEILDGMGHLNFAFISQDVMYLIPRDGEWALTDADLEDTKFDYLRPIEQS